MEGTDTPRAHDRPASTPCAFEVSTPATLDEALAAGLSLPDALDFELTWTEDSADWLGIRPTRKTRATLVLQRATARELRVYTPGRRELPLCQGRVELRVDGHLGTADEALDSSIEARVTLWPNRLDAELRLTEPLASQAMAGASAIVGRLELVGREPRVALQGRQYAARTSPGGKPSAVVGETLLATTGVAPSSGAAVSGSLTEAALRE